MPPAEDSAAGRARRGPVDPRLLRYATASRGFFVALAAIALAQTVVIVLFAWLLTTAIVGLTEGMRWPALSPLLAQLAGVVVVRAVLIWVREAVAARASAAVQQQLRAALVDAVGTLGPGWLAARSSAQLAVTAGRGLEALDGYFARYLPQLVQTAVATPLIVIMMWWQDWISGLTVVLTIPLIPLFMVLIGLGTQAVQRRQWRTLQTLAARFADTVRGMSTLIVFGRQHRAVESIRTVTERYRRETMRVLRMSFLSGFALELLASLSVAIVALTIGFRLLDGDLALSVGLFVLLLAPEAYLPLRMVGVQFHAAAEGVAATEDVFEVLDAASAGSARPAGTARTLGPQEDDSSRIVLLSAEPPRAAPLVVERMRVERPGHSLGAVDLHVAGGTVTLLEGPSGSGKSSVLAALRGAAPFGGEARFGGVDVRELAPSAWLAWAGQQPGLIAGTVAANVALGTASPDPALVARSLELACAADISPDLVLGVRGQGLSGGQAQRVAVARAFHRRLAGRASVIALDEPSSALDAATEARLWQSVRALADAGAAVLLVSHRTSARAIADTIVALEASEARG